MIAPWRNHGVIGALALVLQGCQGVAVQPPRVFDMPPGEWVYVKGESKVSCQGQGEEGYYISEYATQMSFDVPDEEHHYDQPQPVGVKDERLAAHACEQDFYFVDGRNAYAQRGACGPKVQVLEAHMQLVSPRLVYLRRYYEVENPYDEPYDMSCTIFESGYLRPVQDWIDGAE